MRPAFTSICATLWLVALLVFTSVSGFAAGLDQDIQPAEANIGDQVVVTLTLLGGTVNDLKLPPVDGLQVVGSRFSNNYIFSNGTLSRTTTLKFGLVASRGGSFVIPSFEIRTNEGEVLHTRAMKVLVYDNPNTAATNNAPAPAAPAPTPVPNTATTANPVLNPNGPVVQPLPSPANPSAAPAPPTNPNPAANSDADANVPRDPDGSLAKVFILITPDTTDAYVGQSVQMRIDFFIRMDVAAEQNSLPTIKGSDFLMNAFMNRGHENIIQVGDQQYGRETWITAISAPKSGDFPLSMERDTYWIKSISAGNSFDPFGGFFTRHQNLAHEMVASNLLVMHIHALPDEGRPDHFTGAIGQFQVTGSAHPDSVAVGEPVTLDFSVAGTGNFDYIHCPVLPEDPAWKQYVPSSKTDYRDEAHIHAVKTFEQSVIAKQNGDLQLPPASFSYFDPDTKQYVTVPIPLPAITVTGSAAPIASTAPAADSDSTAVAVTPNTDLLPNRFEIGTPHFSLLPAYRQPLFWMAQGGLLILPALGLLLFFIRARATHDDGKAERESRRLSQQQEEDAMADAVRRDDAVAFFLAARHAVQLQLGAQWRLSPEAITLREIRARDAQLAETLEPLFTQADAVIYSGEAQPGIDLAQWENRVRTELLQPQPA